jgi:hypothetical protein
LYKNSYKEMLQRWRPKSDGIPSLSSPTYNAQQSWDKLFLFPKCVSFVCTITRRMIFRSWPATLAISSHANTTNTHTAPSTHLLSHSLGWEWQLEKWWKMDLFCPPCNVWRRDIFCHPRVISILYGTLDATIVVVQEREIESLHFILWYVGWWFDISADILAI